jgi:hypothetical protein
MDKYRICQLEVYESSREAHITFCTPETRNAIGEFLSFRERLGEKLTLDTPWIEFETQFDARVPAIKFVTDNPKRDVRYDLKTTS